MLSTLDNRVLSSGPTVVKYFSWRKTDIKRKNDTVWIIIMNVRCYVACVNSCTK